MMKNLFLKSVVVVMLILTVGTLLIGSGIAPSAYNLIQNSGTPLIKRSSLNFVNGGCVDNAGQARTDCTFLTTAPANFVCSFTSQTSVTCNHNLNTTAVVVSVYDAASPPNLIIPTTEQITDSNNVTVTFSTSQSGKVVVSGSSGSGGGGGGGTPGGSATQWQYNNSGAFGGLVGTGFIPQTPSWTVVSNPGGELTVDDFSTAFLDLHVPSATSLVLNGIFQNLGSSTSYTIVARIQNVTQFGGSSGAMEGDLTLTDGTKFITLEVLQQGSYTSNPHLRVTTWSAYNTQVSTLVDTTDIVGNIATLKIVGDAVHRTYFYWSSGAYVQFYQEAIGTFLTETQGGIGIACESSLVQQQNIDVLLWYWSNTTP